MILEDCKHPALKRVTPTFPGGDDTIVCASCHEWFGKLPSAAAAVTAAIGTIGNFTEPDHDPRLAAVRCDEIALHARRRAAALRGNGYIRPLTRTEALAQMERGRAEYAEIMEARKANA